MTVTFADQILNDFPLTRGKARILTLMKFLERLEPRGRKTQLTELATAFVHRSQRRGMVIVISDLFDPSGFEHGLDLLRHHRYEPHVLQLYDRQEAEPDFMGDVELLDVETEELRKRTITEKNQRQYRLVFNDFLERVRTYCRGYGIGCTTSSTETAFDELVLGMLRAAGTVKAS